MVLGQSSRLVWEDVAHLAKTLVKITGLDTGLDTSLVAAKVYIPHDEVCLEEPDHLHGDNHGYWNQIAHDYHPSARVDQLV